MQVWGEGKGGGVVPSLEIDFRFLLRFYYFYYRLHTLRREVLSS